MSGWFKARILSPVPDSVYEDQVYTQTAVLEMPDGKMLYAFDPDMITRAHMIDTVREIVLLSYMSNVKKLDVPKFGIVPDQKYKHWGGHMFYGLIEQVSSDKRFFILNTGYGRIQADFLENKDNADVGDFVEVVCGRLDLRVIAKDDGRVIRDPFKIF